MRRSTLTHADPSCRPKQAKADPNTTMQTQAGPNTLAGPAKNRWGTDADPVARQTHTEAKPSRPSRPKQIQAETNTWTQTQAHPGLTMPRRPRPTQAKAARHTLGALCAPPQHEIAHTDTNASRHTELGNDRRQLGLPGYDDNAATSEHLLIIPRLHLPAHRLRMNPER